MDRREWAACSPFWKCTSITKTFPGVKALTDVNLTVMPAEIHARRRRKRRRQVDADEGAVRRLSARQLYGRNPLRGQGAAILRASPTAKMPASSSFTRNWLWCRCCRLPRTSSSATRPRDFGVINWFEAFARTKELLEKVGLKRESQHADHQSRHRQAAAGRDRQGAEQEGQAADPRRADLEPERDRFRTRCWRCCSEFKAQGISSILITHKLNEVLKVADRITVLRDGTTIDTLDCPDGESQTRTASSRRWSAANCPTAIRRATPTIGEPVFEVAGLDASITRSMPSGR